MLAYKRNYFLVITCLLISFLTSSSLLWSAGSESTSSKSETKSKSSKKSVEELYREGKVLADSWNYNDALKILKQAHKLDKKNADVLNMLAYTQRNLGKLDKAFKNYKKALKLKPKFPEAREYLGEAHIQAALQEIKTLQSYGSDATGELGQLIDSFKKAAKELDSIGK